jgi:hypothetical protein
MREKCARVLAAALMTGAIGFALAMPAIFETARKAGRSLTAPPSFLQRSVHVVASAPSGSARRGRLEGTQPIQPASLTAAAGSGSTPTGSTPAYGRHSLRAGQSGAGPKPAPKPAPKPPPKPIPAVPARELASTTPAAAVSPPAPTQAPADHKGKGKKGKQRVKSKGKPPNVAQSPVAATTPQPANASSTTEGETDHGNNKGEDKGKDNGEDKGKDKGKNDDKGHNG